MSAKKQLPEFMGIAWIAIYLCTFTSAFAQETGGLSKSGDAIGMSSKETRSQSHEVVYFDDDRNPNLFDQAKVKSDFWSLCRYFESEQMLTYCGVASSVMTLNSLGVASPDIPQIYPYKMFTQDNFFTDPVLEIRRPTEVEKEGSTLDQLAAMLSCFDVDVNQYRTNEMSLDQTRKLIVNALRSPNQRVIVDLDRAALGQLGGGHFSPLAAWNESEDRFLMMDVARYKLPPSWVTAERLHRAMSVVDPVSGKPRGLLVLIAKKAAVQETQKQ